MGCWQVWQRPVQHLRIGWSSWTVLGRVRPAAGLLGEGVLVPALESKDGNIEPFAQLLADLIQHSIESQA
jgi:hypothetical protein